MLRSSSFAAVSEPQNPVISPLSKEAEKPSITPCLKAFVLDRRQVMFSQWRGLMDLSAHCHWKGRGSNTETTLMSYFLLPGDAPRCEARVRPPELWGELSRVLNPNAAGTSIFADHHATAVEEINHGGDRLTTIAGAGSHDGDQFAEGVFGAVDFFIDVFHGSFYLPSLTACMMPAFKIFFPPVEIAPLARRSPSFRPRKLK